MRFRYLTLFIAFIVHLNAFAEEQKQDYDIYHFQADVVEKVEQDLMLVRMEVELQAGKAKTLSGMINDTMRWAISQADQVKSVKVQTANYQTYPVYDKQRIKGWRGRQELLLESAGFDDLSELVGVLQEKLLVKQMGFAISEDKNKAVENRLISTALEAFKQRAEIIRKSMGSDSYRVVNVNINTGRRGIVQPMRVRTLAMEDAGVGPAAVEAGTTDVTVTVSGAIQLGQ